MSGFDISPASLRQSSEDLVGVVDRVAEALTRLETSLHGFGSPWGTGLIGSLIGELYQGIHDMAMASYEANAEVMSEYSEGLDGMADTLQEQEAQIESGMIDLGSQLAATFPGTGQPR
jgi:hypothetical protein